VRKGGPGQRAFPTSPTLLLVTCACLPRARLSLIGDSLNNTHHVRQIDVVSYDGVSPDAPVWPALLGVNAQLSFITHATAREWC
jgi:hypothetical protein